MLAVAGTEAAAGGRARTDADRPAPAGARAARPWAAKLVGMPGLPTAAQGGPAAATVVAAEARAARGPTMDRQAELALPEAGMGRAARAMTLPIPAIRTRAEEAAGAVVTARPRKTARSSTAAAARRAAEMAATVGSTGALTGTAAAGAVEVGDPSEAPPGREARTATKTAFPARPEATWAPAATATPPPISPSSWEVAEGVEAEATSTGVTARPAASPVETMSWTSA